MVTDGFTGQLAELAAGVRLSELPADVVELARQCVLDWIGVTLAGAREPCASLVVDELAAGGSSGPATVVGRATRLTVMDAALANGTASHALDYDDVNEAMLGHPSVPILAGLLALAEHTGASGAEVMAAFVAGYETECRVGRAAGPEHYQRGFHATGTVGTFGAAAACGRLLDFDPSTMATALGLAATEAAGLKCMFGTMGKPLHAGRASAAGLLAARLAARGFTAASGALETVQGFGETHSSSWDPERGLRDAPSGWWLRENLFKFHAACFQTHSSIEGLRRLAETHGLTAPDVEDVVIHASPAQMRMCAIPQPETGLEVKFSLRHTAAMVLSGRDTSAISCYSDAGAADPDVCRLRDRVEVVVDGPPAGATPVEVGLRDGRRLRAAHDVSVPERDLAHQGERLAAKFAALAGPVIGVDRTEALRGAVAGLEDMASVASLLAMTGGTL